jgi:hypothetical protein
MIGRRGAVLRRGVPSAKPNTASPAPPHPPVLVQAPARPRTTRCTRRGPSSPSSTTSPPRGSRSPTRCARRGDVTPPRWTDDGARPVLLCDMASQASGRHAAVVPRRVKWPLDYEKSSDIIFFIIRNCDIMRMMSFQHDPRAERPVLRGARQLDDAHTATLVGLTQAVVFRRARAVVFGYVSSSMKALNQRWRHKVSHPIERRLLPPTADRRGPEGQSDRLPTFLLFGQVPSRGPHMTPLPTLDPFAPR